jgi:peroxiredoxin
MDHSPLSHAPLRVHGLIPSFQLQALNRDAEITPWTYKQRYNLVILFFHDATCEACCNLLLRLAQQYSSYRTCDTEVLAIATHPHTDAIQTLQQFAEHHTLPFPIMWTQDETVRHAYLGKNTSPSTVGVFVCDRYGELHMQAIADEADHLPSEADIRSWVEFVDMQSPGCCTPMW